MEDTFQSHLSHIANSLDSMGGRKPNIQAHQTPIAGGYRAPEIPPMHQNFANFPLPQTSFAPVPTVALQPPVCPKKKLCKIFIIAGVVFGLLVLGFLIKKKLDQKKLIGVKKTPPSKVEDEHPDLKQGLPPIRATRPQLPQREGAKTGGWQIPTEAAYFEGFGIPGSQRNRPPIFREEIPKPSVSEKEDDPHFTRL